MRLLLDSNVVLWWLENRSFDPAASAAIADPSNDVYVSAVTPWEIAVKAKLGTLQGRDDFAAICEAKGFVELPVTMRHGLAAGALELHHNDPFDRMLVAQAQLEGLTLVTRDQKSHRYGVAFLKA